MQNGTVHLIASLLWGFYGIIIGSLVVVFSYHNDFAWISVVVAVIGNSTHLVAFSYSQGKISVQATGQVGKPPN
jgi:hypothetical protein